MRSPQRDVVDSRVAGDVIERVGLADVARAAPDHDGELGLPVDLGRRVGGHDDGFARTDERRGRRLEEEVRTGGGGAAHLHLAHVRVVVGARAQHLARVP